MQAVRLELVSDLLRLKEKWWLLKKAATLVEVGRQGETYPDLKTVPVF